MMMIMPADKDTTCVPSPPRRHPTYYFDDGNIVFLIEGYLFRIHRHFLTRDSVVFRDMLSLPTAVDLVPEGVSDDNPIWLEGVKSIDFGRLLWLLYLRIYEECSASANVWASIVLLADMWKFDGIQEFAIKKLGDLPMNPLEKLELARRFDIGQPWAEDALLALIDRPEPLTVEETLKVGAKNSRLIANIREKYPRTTPKDASNRHRRMPRRAKYL